MKTIRLLTLAAASLCAAAAHAREEINLFCWSEYVPQEIIDDFTAQTGIKVNVENYASNEEMLAKLKAGAIKYDLIQPSEYVVEQLAKAGGLLPLDFKNIPNFKNILPEFKGLQHDPGSKYSVPWMAGTVGIVINTAEVKDDIRGYKDLFQPKFKGRIVALDDPREMVSWAFSTLGIPINDVTPDNLAKARPVVASWLPLIKAFDSDSPKDKLLAGDVDLGVVWSGEAAILWQEDQKYRYVLPAEGAHLFIDSLAVPRGAQNQAAAEKFINYTLEPAVSVKISEAFPYTNPNGEARKLLSAEQLANPASYPPKASLETFRDIGEAGALIDTLITDLKSAE